MRHLALSIALAGLSTLASAAEVAQFVAPPRVAETENMIVLKNDSFVDGGGQAYLQLGFVAGEMAGAWLKVPESIAYFKIDYFRVLFGDSGTPEFNNQVFFQMGIADAPGPSIPRDIENAAQLTSGPFWNDIPAQGDGRSLPCARGGQFVGAALEFTHTGSPSVYRDLDGLGQPTHNTLMAVPGGWAYSVQYGLRGDWILRVVGREASAEECGA